MVVGPSVRWGRALGRAPCSRISVASTLATNTWYRHCGAVSVSNQRLFSSAPFGPRSPDRTGRARHSSRPPLRSSRAIPGEDAVFPGRSDCVQAAAIMFVEHRHLGEPAIVVLTFEPDRKGHAGNVPAGTRSSRRFLQHVSPGHGISPTGGAMTPSSRQTTCMPRCAGRPRGERSWIDDGHWRFPSLAHASELLEHLSTRAH